MFQAPCQHPDYFDDLMWPTLVVHDPDIVSEEEDVFVDPDTRAFDVRYEGYIERN